MRVRAAVLEQFGMPLVVREVELAEPRAGAVLVRTIVGPGGRVARGATVVEQLVRDGATGGSESDE